MSKNATFCTYPGPCPLPEAREELGACNGCGFLSPTAYSMHSALELIGNLLDPGESDPAGMAELLRKIGKIQAAALAGTAQAEPVTVLVNVRGGLVQGTSANGPATVFVLDYDTDGSDAEGVEIEGENVNAYEESPKVEPERVNAILQIIRPTTGNPQA